MADLKISQLASLPGGSVDAADELPIVHLAETRKVTVKNLLEGGVGDMDAATIPSAKIDFAAASIISASLSTDAVTTTKIQNDAVTAAKLANNSAVVTGTSLPAAGDYTGQIFVNTSDNKGSYWNGSAWLDLIAKGSVNTVTGNTASLVNLTATANGDTISLAASLDNTSAANQFLAGPTNAGGDAVYRTIDPSDLPVANTSLRGAVIVNGNGLTMDAGVIKVDNAIAAQGSPVFHKVAYNAQGLITSSSSVVGADLPIATNSATGAVQPGTGLTVTGAGVLNHSNTVASGTINGVSYDTEGHITNISPLTANDIPSLPASKITTGTLNADLLGTNSITGNKLGNSSTVQFGGANSTTGIVAFPVPQFTGQYFWDASNKDLYIFDGNTWQPVTITSGELILAGTYNASTNRVASITTAGSALGLTIGGVLPAAATANERYYLVVAVSGNGVAPAPAVALAPPDMLLSNGTTWELIDVSNAIAGQTAVNISVTPYGNIVATDVQAALQELDDEKFGKLGGTVTGELLIGTAGSLKFEGSTADAYETEIAVVNPTLDRTITLPDQSGTVLVAGNASIVNADINSAAAISFSKLESLSSGNILVGNSSNVATPRSVAGDVEISNTGVTSIAANVIVDADINSSAAISGTKIQQGSTSTRGTVQLTDSTTSTSITTAATPNAVKTAYDLADAALPKSGGTMTGVITFAGGQTIAGYLPAAGGTLTGPVTFASSQTFPRIPQNSKTAAYTLVAADAGKHISITTGGITVPSGVFAIGDAIGIYNNSSSSQTIAQGAGVTIRLAGGTFTGNRTLAQYGLCTILCVASDVFVITGAGIS